MDSSELFVSEVRISGGLKEDAYYAKIPAVQCLEKNGLLFDSKVTFLVGENGSGKSTILEAIAIAAGFNPEGGTKNYSFSTKDSYSDLYRQIVLVRRKQYKYGYFLRAESFYNVATMEEEYARNSIRPSREYHQRSHGEAFLELAKDFLPNGLYLLDEPEAALSPSRLMSLMYLIHQLEDTCQFIISTHSPILMSYPDAQVLELNEEGISSIDYRQSENYQLTRQFLLDPDKMFAALFEEEKK